MELKSIVEAARRGDAQAWTQLFEKTQNMVYFTALKLTGDQSAAEDIAQETYLKAMEHIGTLQKPEAFIKWLQLITMNLSKNYLSAKRPALFGGDETDDLIANIPEVREDFLPQACADHKETCRLVASMVDALPEKLRICVILYYYNELPVAQIAALLEISENTVKSRLNYARQQIKKQVEDMEKQGTKLYAAAPVLALILHKAAEDYTLPAPTAAAIKAGFCAAPAAESAAPAAVAGAAKTAGAKAAGGFIARIAALPLVTKIIAAVVAVAIVAGGIVLATSAGKKNDPAGPGLNSAPASSTLSSEEAEALSEFDFTSLFFMTEEDVLDEFGEPHERWEWDDGESYSLNYQYTTKDDRFQSLSVIFMQEMYGNDGYPCVIELNGDMINPWGVSYGMAPEEGKAILIEQGFHYNGSDQYEMDDGQVDIYERFSSADGRLGLDLIHNGEGIWVINLVRQESFFTPDELPEQVPEEPEVSQEPEIPEEPELPEEPEIPEEPEESEEPEEPEEPEESPAALTNAEAREILSNYWRKNCVAGAAWYFFVDLTHDGIDELVNVNSDPMDGSAFAQILSVSDNRQVFELDWLESREQTGYMISYYLYNEGGKAYILEYNSWMREGNGEIYYSIYAYYPGGGQKVLRGNSYNGDALSAEGEAASNAVFNEYVSYRNASKGILYYPDGWLSMGVDNFDAQF